MNDLEKVRDWIYRGEESSLLRRYKDLYLDKSLGMTVDPLIFDMIKSYLAKEIPDWLLDWVDDYMVVGGRYDCLYRLSKSSPALLDIGKSIYETVDLNSLEHVSVSYNALQIAFSIDTSPDYSLDKGARLILEAPHTLKIALHPYEMNPSYTNWAIYDPVRDTMARLHPCYTRAYNLALQKAGELIGRPRYFEKHMV